MSACTIRPQGLPKSGSCVKSATLSHSVPSLELLFAVDCIRDVIKRFVINQPVTLVGSRETVNQVVLMLENATVQVVGHSDIQDS
jgi:hypothetical protein